MTKNPTIHEQILHRFLGFENVESAMFKGDGNVLQNGHRSKISTFSFRSSLNSCTFDVVVTELLNYKRPSAVLIQLSISRGDEEKIYFAVYKTQEAAEKAVQEWLHMPRTQVDERLKHE